MDPNAALAEALGLARLMTDAEEIDNNDARRLGDLVISLHEWIDRGGFLPAAWVNDIDLAGETDGEHYARMNGLPAPGSMRHQIPVRREPEQTQWHQEMS